MKHQPFEALASDEQDIVFIRRVITSVIPRTNNEIVMGVLVNDELIYITKAQCMEFFGLVEPKPIVVATVTYQD